jgi:benzoylformate decarboxylase
MPSVHTTVYHLLRRQGLTTFFGNPGSNELPFLKDFPDDFRYFLGLHEGAVVGMADGYAQASGKPVLVNLHAAAGSGNAMGALTNAGYSHSPLVLLAGQQARPMIGVESMLTNVDALQLPRPLVKWSYEPVEPADGPRALSQAIHTAVTPPQGPVYVSIPHDDWACEVDADKAEAVESRQVSWAGQASEAQIAELVHKLDAATNPVLVLGPEVDAVGANERAVALAERLRAPVWIAPSESRCPFPNRHPCFRGLLPPAIAGISERLDGHDVIAVIGAPVFRYHQVAPGRYLPEGARLLHITSDADEAARAPVGDALVCDISATLGELAERVAAANRPMPEALPVPEPEVNEADRLAPSNLFATVNRLAPEDAIYVKESTATKSAFWSQISMRHSNSFFFPAAGGLGFGLPAAVGVQLARPDRRVIALVGDGSANYAITALWSAAQYRVPVIFVILKNETYGALRWFSHELDAPNVPGMDVPGLDFCSIARGYGVEATAITDIAAFEDVFVKALADTARPYLIEVPTTFSDT